MYYIKQINDVETRTSVRSVLIHGVSHCACLYPLLYSMSTLRFKSESTQQTYLQGVKQWYEFWQEKYHQSFCMYFYERKSDPQLMIQEVDNFIVYLENERVFNNNLIALTINHSSNLNTIANRLRSVLSYLNYLLDNFSQSHGNTIGPKITKYKSILSQKSNIIRNLSSSHHKAHKIGSGFKSLTEGMRNTLYAIISPKALDPLFKNEETKLRNFLIVHLLLNYGLRVGELLLLTLNSIKLDSRTNNTYLYIEDRQDETDDRASKPQIKNVQSKRVLLLEQRDAALIQLYIEKIRSQDSESSMLFLSLKPPYSPLSKSGIKKIMDSINKSMQSRYPHFFDTNYVDSIHTISAHTLRHTWAYMMLKSSYNLYLEKYNNKAQAMKYAIEELKKMAGWSLNSTMPYLYANRFISEKANLANAERIRKLDIHYDS